MYRVPILPRTEHDELAEAVAWTLGRGVVSHESALVLHGLSDVNPTRIHLTVPRDNHPRAAGGDLYRLHRRDLPAVDVTEKHDLPVTTVVRTIRDCLRAATDRATPSSARAGSRRGWPFVLVKLMRSAKRSTTAAALEGYEHEWAQLITAGLSVAAPTLLDMTANRDELIHLIEGLPEDQVEVLLADARRLSTKKQSGEWPPKFFAIGESTDGRTDNARRADEVLASGFGARRS